MKAERNQKPTLREVLAGYQRFNRWELEEQGLRLPGLSIEESLTQYFELCSLVRALAPEAQDWFLEEYAQFWASRWRTLQRLTQGIHAAAT